MYAINMAVQACTKVSILPAKNRHLQRDPELEVISNTIDALAPNDYSIADMERAGVIPARWADW